MPCMRLPARLCLQVSVVVACATVRTFASIPAETVHIFVQASGFLGRDPVLDPFKRLWRILHHFRSGTLWGIEAVGVVGCGSQRSS